MTQAAAATSVKIDSAKELKVVSLTVITSTAQIEHNHATVNCELNGSPVTFEAPGKGPIDAICKALDKLEPGFRVEQWKGVGEGAGSDANASIHVTIYTDDGKVYHGEGSHPNTLQATASAIVDALNKHFFHLHKFPPRS